MGDPMDPGIPGSHMWDRTGTVCTGTGTILIKLSTLLFSTLKPPLATTLSSSSLISAPTGCAVCDAARPPSTRIPLSREEWDRVLHAFLALLSSQPLLQCSVSAKSNPGLARQGFGGGDSRLSEKDRDWKAAVAEEDLAWKAWEPVWDASSVQVETAPL